MSDNTLDARLLAIPGVTRVRRHGPDILRILVDPLDEKPGQLAIGGRQKRDHLELFDVASKALNILGQPWPANLSVHFEPGVLPDGYEIHEDEDCDGEPPDAAGVGGCLPTAYWPLYHWERPEFDDAGPRRKDRTQAIDDAWDDSIRPVEEA